MIKSPKDLQSVRKEIQAFYEKEVRVHVNLGRNKSADFTGTLSWRVPRPLHRAPARQELPRKDGMVLRGSAVRRR